MKINLNKYTQFSIYSNISVFIMQIDEFIQSQLKRTNI